MLAPMMPIPASQIFPSPCAHYTAGLGEQQAAAFALLWDLKSQGDPIMNFDNAYWHLNQELKFSKGTVRTASMEILRELFDGLRALESKVGSGANSVDIAYASLFVKIASWEHEHLAEHLNALEQDLYA